MPVKPRLYAIPKMAPADVSKSASSVARMVRDNDNFLRYLDSIGPEHYCARHDMYRPCRWCAD